MLQAHGVLMAALDGRLDAATHAVRTLRVAVDMAVGTHESVQFRRCLLLLGVARCARPVAQHLCMLLLPPCTRVDVGQARRIQLLALDVVVALPLSAYGQLRLTLVCSGGGMLAPLGCGDDGRGRLLRWRGW